MTPFRRGGKAKLKNFGSPADGIPADGDYRITKVTDDRVTIDVGNEVLTLEIHRASRWEWAEEGGSLMYTALA